MFGFLIAVALSGGPRPPQAPPIEQRVSKLEIEVAELRADLAAYKAHYGSAPKSATQPVGYIAVTKATEVHHPGLLNVAGAVATAPLKAVTRTVCGVNGCQTFEVQPSGFEGQTFEVPSQTFGVQGDCSNGNCSSGQCGMQTQRRGFFGRKRGW